MNTGSINRNANVDDSVGGCVLTSSGSLPAEAVLLRNERCSAVANGNAMQVGWRPCCLLYESPASTSTSRQWRRTRSDTKK